MAASKAQVPPVNLKERIAALQQRNVSPSQHPSTQPPNKSAPTFGAGGLRDRIAKFEEKGGVPVPRASFGMNVPQLPENAPAKRRGELYANRVQGLGRPSGAPTSRSSSPLPPVDDSTPRKRCISTSAAGLDNSSLAQNDGPVPPLPSSGPFSSTRRNTLTANFAGARRVASSSDAVFGTYDIDFPSASHVALPPIQSESRETEEPSAVSSEPITSAAPDDSPIVLAVMEEPSEIPESSSFVLEAPPVQDSPADSDVTEHVDLFGSEVSVPAEEPAEESLNPENDDQDHSPSATESLDVGYEEVVEELHVEVAEVPPAPETECVAEKTPEVTALQDKGDEAPDTASMTDLVDPKPEVVEESADSVPSPPSIITPPEVNPSTSAAPVELEIPTVTLTPIRPSTPTKVEPVTEPACAPSTPTNQAIPIIVSPISPSSEDKHSDSDIGSITIHVGDDSSKPAKSNIAVGARRWTTVPKQTFTAVVHGKKTEIPLSTSASNLVAPVTPQITRVRQTAKINTFEPPASPGYGELAVLLEEAALLERRLAEGDADSDQISAQPEAPVLDPQPSEATIYMETVPEEDTHSESVPTPTSRTESIQDSVRTTEYTDAMSISTRSISVPSIKEPVIHDDIPEEDEGSDSVPPTPPPKSPLPKYLSGIRRFASSSSSRRSSAHMPGAYPRDSISVSSEDSMSVATPPDNGFDLNGNGIAWPSVSPKKSNPVSRSSSFADRFFNRSRTKSNMSHTEGDDIPVSRSSTSSRFHTVSGSPDSSPSKRSTARNLVGASLTRPNSTISLASTTSNMSPSGGLFDKDIFDAFPSVPETLPPGPAVPHSHLSPDDYPPAVGRSSTMPVKSRKHSAQRFSMV